MASEYRQLGTPRFQPQQQVGGYNIQAPRDLGAESFLKGFAGLSQSLAAAGQRQSKEEIEKALAAGEAWRKQSQKTFREAVAAGEIHPTQNPHFAIGAMAADGDMNARKLTNQWLSEWQAEIADPESEPGRTQGGFDVFMQDKLAAYEKDDPFVSHYQANSFYNVAHRVISGNSVKQNEDALERDLYHTTKGHIDNLLDLAFPTDLGIPYASGFSQEDLQEAYDKDYNSGAVRPMLQAMLLDRAYKYAIDQDEQDPETLVKRITGLTLGGGATLGDTALGIEVATGPLGSKLRAASVRWRTKTLDDLKRSGAVFEARHEDHAKFLKNHKDTLEAIVTTGDHPLTGAPADTIEYLTTAITEFREVGTWLASAYGTDSAEYQEWRINNKNALLELGEVLTSAGKVETTVASFMDYGNPEAWYDAEEDAGGKNKFDPLIWAKIKDDPNRDRILAQIHGWRTGAFPPYERWLLAGQDALQQAMRTTSTAGDLPPVLMERFESYANVRKREGGLLTGEIFSVDNLLSQTFDAALSRVDDDPTRESLGTALAAVIQDTVVSVGVGGGVGGGGGRQGGTYSAKEFEQVQDAFDVDVTKLPQAVQSTIRNILFEGVAKNPNLSRGAAFTESLEGMVASGRVVIGSNSSSIDFPSNITDPDLREAFTDGRDGLRGDYANAVNVHLNNHILSTLDSEETRKKIAAEAGMLVLPKGFNMERYIAWRVLGGLGTVPSNWEDMQGRFRLELGEMLETALPFKIIGLEPHLVMGTQPQDQFTDGLKGFFFGNTPVTLDGLMERAPQETLEYLRSQEWYEDPDDATGWVDPKNLYLVFLPNGSAKVYHRDDEDSDYEDYMPGSGEGMLSGVIQPNDVKGASESFLSYRERSGAMSMVWAGKEEHRELFLRRIKAASEEAGVMDATVDAVLMGFARELGIEIGPTNIFKKLESVGTWVAEVGVEAAAVAMEHEAPTTVISPITKLAKLSPWVSPGAYAVRSLTGELLGDSDHLISDNMRPPRNYYLRTTVPGEHQETPQDIAEPIDVATDRVIPALTGADTTTEPAAGLEQIRRETEDRLGDLTEPEAREAYDRLSEKALDYPDRETLVALDYLEDKFGFEDKGKGADATTEPEPDTTPDEQEEYHRLYENSRREIENDRLPFHKWSTERAQEELDKMKRKYEPTYESEPTQRAWRSASIAAWTDAIKEGFFDGNTGTEPDTGSAQVRRGDIEKAEAADTEEEVHAATGLSSEEHFITERNRHVEHFRTRKDFGEKEAQAFLDMLKDDRRRGVMDTAPEHEKIGFEARIAALQALLDEGFFIAKRGLK